MKMANGLKLYVVHSFNSVNRKLTSSVSLHVNHDR